VVPLNVSPLFINQAVQPNRWQNSLAATSATLASAWQSSFSRADAVLNKSLLPEDDFWRQVQLTKGAQHARYEKFTGALGRLGGIG